MEPPESETGGACRCCLRDATGGSSIFSTVKKTSLSYAEMMRELCSLVACQDDGMLSKICPKCSHKLKSSFKFRRMCVGINTLLLQKIEQPNFCDNYEVTDDGNVTDESDAKVELELPQNDEDAPDMKEITVFDDAECKIEYETIYESYNSIEYNLEDAEKISEGPFVEAVKEEPSGVNLNNNIGGTETGLFDELDNNISVVELNDIKIKHEPDDNVCNQCGCTFSNKNVLYKHRYSVHGQKRLLCHHCSKTFRRKDHLERHIKSHMKEDNPYVCSVCAEKFRTEAALRKHTRLNHRINQVKSNNIPKITSHTCLLCGKYCRTALRLREHLSYVHKGLEYFCELCKKFYTSESRHISRNHGNGRQCDLCGIFYTTKAEWISHMNSEHPTKCSLKCADCEKIFTSYVALSRHRSAVHAGRTWICQYCSKVCKRKDKLNDHLKVHSSERPYKCDECKKAFHTRSLLNKHKLTHSPEKNFICDHCNARFKTKKCLRQHHTRHDPKALMRYACALCKKTFRRSDHRNIHQRNVHKLENCNLIQSKNTFSS